MKKYLIPLFYTICLIALFTSCEKERPTSVSVEEWREDFNFLKTSLEEYEPALYEYNSRARINEVYDSLLTQIKDTGWVSFFKIASRLGAEVNEGHLSIGSNDDPFRKGFYDGTFKYLPLSVFYTNNKLYLWKQVTEDTLFQKGDEILSINGKPSDEIIEYLLPFIFSDGNIISYKRATINALFPWLYYWYIEQPPSFDIAYLSITTGETCNITLPALTYKQIIDAATSKYADEPVIEEKGNKFFNLEINDNTAYLKLKSFDWRIVEELKLDADMFYEKIFKDFKEKKIENLIIDLRNNTGGRKEFANAIIPYINKNHFSGNYFESISYDGDRTEYETPENSPYLFEGKIFVIVNAKSFSSGTTLAVFLKEMGDAIVIGEETGGRFEGFAAGSSEVVYLPNSRIMIKIPRYWMRNLAATSQNTINRGLIPDYKIRYSMKEKMEGVDKELNFVYELINNSSKP